MRWYVVPTFVHLCELFGRDFQFQFQDITPKTSVWQELIEVIDQDVLYRNLGYSKQDCNNAAIQSGIRDSLLYRFTSDDSPG